ncbi:hypothetical protein Tb11.01.4710 [Trypanosoma brucei brucei TREU927]|uniref:Uncharacterized protein n=1 Tax=Trypanosoma brucei brucei (strain 927/4 GUTat10.1) TaxID=185431 RepID=Q382M0_TRYB2|nr:hypothetical protein Tb11.01.4710 [Trypanosoma brucei brucei TREU927]EAN80261.1 hypothetical protein Tb11.01.4710 [Trypanosoma brucei brucei TREU927]
MVSEDHLQKENKWTNSLIFTNSAVESGSFFSKGGGWLRLFACDVVLGKKNDGSEPGACYHLTLRVVLVWPRRGLEWCCRYDISTNSIHKKCFFFHESFSKTQSQIIGDVGEPVKNRNLSLRTFERRIAIQQWSNTMTPTTLASWGHRNPHGVVLNKFHGHRGARSNPSSHPETGVNPALHRHRKGTFSGVCFYSCSPVSDPLECTGILSLHRDIHFEGDFHFLRPQW